MDSSKKTALTMSLLVLPGSGHWYLGLKKLGSLIAAASLCAMLYPLALFTGTLREQIELIALDNQSEFPSIVDAFSVAWQSEGNTIIVGLIILLLIWIFAAVDILRIKEK